MEKEEKEYYSVVTWKDPNGKTHIVGTLAYFDGKYYFKYEHTSLKKARENNFTDIASFNDDKKLYISENSLFSFFKMRVSPKVKDKPEAMEELIRKNGKSTVDDISIIEFPERYRPAIKAEIQRLEKDQLELEDDEKGY